MQWVKLHPKARQIELAVSMCTLQINQLKWARLTSVCSMQRWLRWIAMVSHIHCDTRRSSCCTQQGIFKLNKSHLHMNAEFNLTHIECLEKTRNKGVFKGANHRKYDFPAQRKAPTTNTIYDGWPCLGAFLLQCCISHMKMWASQVIYI